MRALLRPRWVVGSVIVVAVVAAFVNLGLWQLRRLDERQARNQTVSERASEVVALPASGWGDARVDDLVYRRVRVTGEYDPDHEMLVRFQTREGAPGWSVVTPLVTDEGAVLVDRGWVPNAVGEQWPTEDGRAPAGRVTVEGVLARPDPGSVRPSRDGRLLTISAIQPAALADELPYDDVYGLYLLATEGTADAFPVPPAAPDLGEGPHLSYALQWFSFAAIVGVGWVVVLRRVAIGERRSEDAGAGEA